MEQLKHCKFCGQAKAVSEFYRNRTSWDGLQHACKDCNKAQVKAWKLRNMERVKAYRAISLERRKAASA